MRPVDLVLALALAGFELDFFLAMVVNLSFLESGKDVDTESRRVDIHLYQSQTDDILELSISTATTIRRFSVSQTNSCAQLKLVDPRPCGPWAVWTVPSCLGD